MTDTTTAARVTITAQPCGKDRHGNPIRTHTYVIDRDPEDWGNNRSRIFAENRTVRHGDGSFVFAPVVVRTDSIVRTPATMGDLTAGDTLRIHGVDVPLTTVEHWTCPTGSGCEEHIWHGNHGHTRVTFTRGGVRSVWTYRSDIAA